MTSVRRVLASTVAGILSLAATMVITPTASAIPSLPVNDLTGDGTADSYELLYNTDSRCYVNIIVQDTSGPFRGGYTIPLNTGVGVACPDLLASGQFRVDGSWQIVFDRTTGLDASQPTSLTTVVRLADHFVLEVAALSTIAPYQIEFYDRNNDGRPDRVYEWSQPGKQAYEVEILGDGHWGASYPSPSYGSELYIRPASTTPSFGDPFVVHSEVWPDYSFPVYATEVVIPTGSMTYTIDGVTVGSYPLIYNANGGYSYTNPEMPRLSPGAHHVVARYSGDQMLYPGSVSADYTVLPSGTTTTAVSKSPTISGQSFTQQFKVKSLSTSTRALVPTGTIIPVIDGVDKPALTLASGAASMLVSGLTAGNHTISARYSGSADGGYQPSTMTPMTHVVNKGSVKVSLDAADTSTVFGQIWSNTVKVTAIAPAAGIPTGKAAFVLDGVSKPAVSLAKGSAAFSFSGLSVGAHTLAVSYSGDGNFSVGSMVTITHTVAKAATTTGITLTPASPRVNAAASAKITVATTAPGTGAPAGSVSVVVDGGTAKSYPLSSGSVAIPVKFTKAGSHLIKATYAGDASRTGSTLSKAVTVVP